jgi:hypothetical protein
VDEWFAFGADGNKFGVAGGLTLPEVGAPGRFPERPRIIGISEYAWLRDSGQVSVGKLVDVLCGALKR